MGQFTEGFCTLLSKFALALTLVLQIPSMNLHSWFAQAISLSEYRSTSFAQAATVQAVVAWTIKNDNAKIKNKPVTTQAQAGEGVIRITTRVCSSSQNWQSVAADNGIAPPVYLVLLGQELAVNCQSTTVPVVAPQPVPEVPAAVVPQTGGSGWTQPLSGVCFAGGGSGFHTAERPTHDGVDLPADFGTPIHAAAAGTVSVGWQAGGAGNYTVIDHGNGIVTVYMHQSSFNVTSGWVNAGDVIGYIGSTGNSSGPHLHFEVHTVGAWNGKVDPVPWMWEHGAGIAC